MLITLPLMKKLLLILCILGTFKFAWAQEYHFGVGGRWGKVNSGLSLKYMGSAENNKGLQLDIYRTYIYSQGWTAKLFYVQQAPIRSSLLQIPLDWIWGVGAHVGYFRNNKPIYDKTPVYPYHKRKSYFNSKNG